jgi:hypothetical protein
VLLSFVGRALFLPWWLLSQLLGCILRLVEPLEVRLYVVVPVPCLLEVLLKVVVSQQECIVIV